MRLRGLEERHELSPQLLIRDTRTLGMKVVDFFKDPANSAILMFSFAMAAFVLAPIADLLMLIGLCVFAYAYTRKLTLPFRMPLRSNTWDYNDLIPGDDRMRPRKARGISFFGNQRSNNDELWFNNDDMRTHVLIFGSTGSGKTVALTSLAYNALVQASGFLYVDGKGDNSLFANIFSMCRTMGRDDDLLLINFMTGARDVIGAQEKRLSNTMNPFCNGSSSMLSQLVVSLMDQGTQSADGDMWKGRAIVFVEALMKVLVYMRDQGKILLDANTVRNYFELTRLESIVMDKLFPRDNQEPVSLADAPEVVLEPINNYIINLPGYDRSKKGKQSSQVLEQHGFITMQLTRVFGSLADTYGHIIRVNLAEVDLKDVVLNRRILVVLLPALEKSPEELSSLGKVIIASLKAMMAAGLGDAVEGTYREVVTRKPTTSPTPFMCILDEYGYYAVKGFAVVPAQARSLGFSVIFAGQDLPAFQKASKEEAASIGANTNIKICMKLEDPADTWEFFHKTAGESYVTKVDSFQTQAGSLLNNYMDSRSASSEKRERVSLLDLKDQREGEAHIFFKSKIVRARMFFADPKPPKKMRLNHFLKVDIPLNRVLFDLEERLHAFQAAVEKGDTFEVPTDDSDSIQTVAKLLKQSAGENAIERALQALLTLQKREESETEEAIHEEEEALQAGHFNIFSQLTFSNDIKTLVGRSQWAQFSAPLVDQAATREHIASVERFLGQASRDAQMAAIDLVRDMAIATDYPPEIEGILLTPNEITQMAVAICEYVQSLDKQEA